ncbi:N-acyl-D-amino-acid deacylase family protein [Pontibacter akesuensis]|uniref:N-acyl-D-amino-acid deacylase n=1 Tax=Pontibacter akesuensis TaxID=388950 RepID=A0A1I7KWJ8_9BACT|nr:amidohydrolase family protein [Pontibacter akesuensis]GHA80593.1 dihydroorotase [Pontibacter akesuensis]SFV01831.1 N-acyl-D-amino-acid deacylase [Pontibacter akesuensis]
MKKQKTFFQNLVALAALVTLSAACQQQQQEVTYDVFVKNATVVDGTGEAAYTAHILLAGDSIALIERDTTATFSAAKVIDARGLTLTPGFIDTHAHGDPIKTPEFQNFIAMGITTITLGQDGFSPEHENLQVWIDSVNQVQPAVNVAPFAGHNTLRLLSGVGYDTVPAEANLVAMEKLLAQAMAAGCFGLTTGLEYTPGLYASSNELNRLAKVVGANNGIIMSHMRNEDDAFVEASIRELLAQGEHCPVHVSHIKVVYGKGEARAAEILQLLDSARAKGIDVTADFYPYTASYTGISILFPEWAQKPNDYQQVLRTRKNELRTFLKEKITKRNGPEATLIGSGPYKGKTLARIAQELNKPYQDVLMEDIGPYGASGAYFIMDEALQEAFLKDPYIMVCTDGSPSMHHPRSFGTHAKVIQTYVLTKKLMPLEQAIWKMTGLPAQTIGIPKRGLIRQGYKADILLFKPSEIKEEATYEEPRQLATGFRYVLVNGKVAKEGESFTEERAGKVLMKGI